MAAKYRKIDPRIWDDEDFERLDLPGKLLAFWILTSNQVNRCGICVWRASLVTEQTGIKQPDTVCDTVCRTLKWVRDTRSRCILLPTWWRYNQPDNVKALKGALSDLHDLPRNDLKSEFAKTKRYLKDTLHQVFDQVLDTVWDRVCAQEQEQEQEQEQGQETGGPARPKRFTKPTLEQVTVYCRERGKGVSPQKWYDHYTANGWKVGKNPMKDWRAAVRNWERNELATANKDTSDDNRSYTPI
jgi:hypothetical protein